VEIAKAMNQGNEIFASLVTLLAASNNKHAAAGASSVESVCVTLQSLVLSISILCKDLWKLFHDINTSVLSDINTSVLTEWNYERISYKPYVTTREIPRITHHK
jgi:hypothetical protein